jgi:hypothetical protein
MRKIVCNSCSFAVTEADKEWDAIAATGKCPKCSAYIQSSQSIENHAVFDPRTIMEFMPAKNSNSVVITDIQMPFLSMVVFMVKWAFASIPAIIIIALVLIFIGGLTGGVASLFKH